MSIDYIEKMGMSDIVPVTSPVSNKNAQQGFDLLMGVRVIALLMAHQSENGDGLSIDRQQDLGSLIYFLTGQPASVLGELESELPSVVDA